MNDIQEVAYRYIKAHVDTHGKGYPEFDIDELQPLVDYVRGKFSEDNGIILHAYGTLIREYAKGHRCSVCGRTRKQNAATGYDCTNEC